MTCPSELTLSCYADGALAPEDLGGLEAHIGECARCRALLENLSLESRALRSAMRSTEVPGAIPAFAPRPTISRLVAWLGWIALSAWAVDTAWMSLASTDSIPGWLGWLAPDATGIGIGLLVGFVLSLVTEGGEMMKDAFLATGWTILAVSAAVGAWLLLRRGGRRTASLCLSLGIATLLLTAAPPGHAFEIRRDEDRVIVAAGEVIDDTLLVMAEDVLIEGTVTGDLLVMGETVTLRGRVGGMLLAAAETLDVEGEVAGSVLGMGEKVALRAPSFAGNLYAMGQTVTVHAATDVAGNVVLMAEEVEMHGSVGRDLLTLARKAVLFGSVEHGFRAHGESVELAETARVGGDLTVMVRSEDKLRVDPGAIVEGERNQSIMPEHRSPYLTPGYYLGQGLKLLAALVTGLVLFRLVPALGGLRLDSGGDLLKAGGLGLVALVATPILAGMAVLTLIGAPLGLTAFLIWLLAVYAAGIVAAALVGRLLLKEDQVRALSLLVGLAVLFVLLSIPLLGALVRLLAIVVGLGLLLQWARQAWERRSVA